MVCGWRLCAHPANDPKNTWPCLYYHDSSGSMRFHSASLARLICLFFFFLFFPFFLVFPNHTITYTHIPLKLCCGIRLTFWVRRSIPSWRCPPKRPDPMPQRSRQRGSVKRLCASSTIQPSSWSFPVILLQGPTTKR